MQTLPCVLYCPRAAGDIPWCLGVSGSYFGSGARHQLKTALAASQDGCMVPRSARAAKPTAIFMDRGALEGMVTLAIRLPTGGHGPRDREPLEGIP